MSRHRAQIRWSSDGRFAQGDYSRAHEWRFDGGQVVRGSSSPSVVREPLSDPFGVDPEEALIAAASSCHMLWFLNLAQQDGFVVESYHDEATGELGKIDGRIGLARISLRPNVEFAGRAPSSEELADLHHQAHEHCFIANSLKTQIVVEEVSS